MLASTPLSTLVNGGKHGKRLAVYGLLPVDSQLKLQLFPDAPAPILKAASQMHYIPRLTQARWICAHLGTAKETKRNAKAVMKP